MANKKFSDFDLKTDPANVDFLVGYDGTDNVRIDPDNLGGGATDLNGLSDCTVLLNSNGDNYFIGTTPGTTGTASYGVTAVGDEAGNSLVLTNSLYSTMSTFVGNKAGALTTSPYQGGITAIGALAGSSNTAGGTWTCVGSGAGQLQQHNGDTIIGFQAAWNGASAEGVIIGKYAQQSGSGVRSISIGKYSSRTNSAEGTISIGNEAGYSQTSGASNTNVGYKAGYQNTTNSYRTYLGYEAGNYNSGAGNTGIGYRACNGYFSFGTGQGTGGNNTAVGYEALSSLNGTGAYGNTAVGKSALGGVITGANNTALGEASGGNITSGSNLTLLGYNAEPSSATATNEITLGDANITALRIPGLQSGASDGDVLTFSSGTGKITLAAAGGGGGASDLNGLSDVSVNSATNSAYFINIPAGLSGDSKNLVIGENAANGFSNANTSVVIGFDASRVNTTNVSGVVIIGCEAMEDVTSTSVKNLVAIGDRAGKGIGNPYNAVIIGAEAGSNNSNGYESVYIGKEAGKSANSNYQVFIGTKAGENANGATKAVAVGWNAGLSATGDNFVAVGYQAGRSSTASGTISIGYQAGYSNTSGANNTNIGYQAGRTNTTNGTNTNVGWQASYYATGQQLAAFGYRALFGAAGVSSGSYNSAFGREAGLAVTSGSQNTLLGASAGKAITTGANNTVIGSFAAFNSLIDGDNNIVIGKEAAPSATGVDNEITLGNASITALRCQVQTISALSDSRDKTNVQPSIYGLDLISQLQPVTFDWNMRDGAKVGDKDLGFIAQELQEVDDENLQLVYANNPDRLEASYGRLIPVLVKAIQELKAEIELLKS